MVAVAFSRFSRCSASMPAVQYPGASVSKYLAVCVPHLHCRYSRSLTPRVTLAKPAMAVSTSSVKKVTCFWPALSLHMATSRSSAAATTW